MRKFVIAPADTLHGGVGASNPNFDAALWGRVPTYKVVCYDTERPSWPEDTKQAPWRGPSIEFVGVLRDCLEYGQWFMRYEQ